MHIMNGGTGGSPVLTYSESLRKSPLPVPMEVCGERSSVAERGCVTGQRRQGPAFPTSGQGMAPEDQPTAPELRRSHGCRSGPRRTDVDGSAARLVWAERVGGPMMNSVFTSNVVRNGRIALKSRVNGNKSDEEWTEALGLGGAARGSFLSRRRRRDQSGTIHHESARRWGGPIYALRFGVRVKRSWSLEDPLLMGRVLQTCFSGTSPWKRPCLDCRKNLQGILRNFESKIGSIHY